MRWELLFEDFESQLHAVSQQDLEQHINELVRVEASQLALDQALRSAMGGRLAVAMCNGTAFHGEVLRVETEWMLLTEGDRSVLLPLAKILRVQGVGSQRARTPSKIPYTLPAALRVLARNRSELVMDLDSAHSATVRGVLDQVGADYVQLTQLADGVGRDHGNFLGSVMIPIAALVSIASTPDSAL